MAYDRGFPGGESAGGLDYTKLACPFSMGRNEGPLACSTGGCASWSVKGNTCILISSMNTLSYQMRFIGHTATTLEKYVASLARNSGGGDGF